MEVFMNVSFQSNSKEFLMSISLWPHQRAAVDAVTRALDQGARSGLWVMPTGTGKTRAYTALAAQLALPTLVVVHRDELLRQAVATFGEVWPEARVATLPGDGWPEAQVLVATVQSLHRRRKELPPDRFGLVVLDEAHHAARSWEEVARHFQPRFLLGCTATPERLDGKPLAGLFGGEPLYVYPLRQAIDDGTRHQLVTASHLFGGEVANSRWAEVRQAIRAVKDRRQRFLAAKLAPKVCPRLPKESPGVWVPDLSGYRPCESWQGQPATDKQVQALGQFGLEVRGELTRGEASYLLDQCF
jgi:superfamily II DNA or RNA helicase